MSSAPRPRLVLFDVDGTLIDAYGAGRAALEDAFATVFGREDAAAHLDAVWFAGRTDMFIFRQLAIEIGITSWEYERRYSELEDCYLARLRARIDDHPGKRILPGVEPLLEALADGAGAALGLMTGNLEAGARLKLDPWSLNRFFPTGGFGSDALERSDIGLVARRRFERRLGTPLDPAEVVLVGDTPSDIEAGRACGFRVLAVGTGWSDRAILLAAAPDLFLPDLSDTAGVLGAIGL